jgi:DNA-binding CsgD family transcriptional regulator
MRRPRSIAQRLGSPTARLTDRTVKTRIYEKLEVRNRVDLYALAAEGGG